MIHHDKDSPEPREELHDLEKCRYITNQAKHRIGENNLKHFGKTNQRLCKWCGQTITASRRRSYCSAACALEWELRTSADVVRWHLKERDKGICNICGIDTITLYNQVNPKAQWSQLLRAWADQNNIDNPYRMDEEETHAWDDERKQILERRDTIFKTLNRSMRIAATGRRSMWDADHVIGVINGGGCCGLDNYQTLCVGCHAKKPKKKVTRKIEPQNNIPAIQKKHMSLRTKYRKLVKKEAATKKKKGRRK